MTPAPLTPTRRRGFFTLAAALSTGNGTPDQVRELAAAVPALLDAARNAEDAFVKAIGEGDIARERALEAESRLQAARDCLATIAALVLPGHAAVVPHAELRAAVARVVADRDRIATMLEVAVDAAPVVPEQGSGAQP